MKSQASPRSFLIVCAVGLPLLIIAAVLYARQKQVPPDVAIPVAAAFLMEYIFYLVPGFEGFRERFAGHRLPALLIASALGPYLLYALPTGQLSIGSLLLLGLVAAIVAFWYWIFPAVWWADLLFILYLTAVILSRALKAIYLSPIPRVPLDILGHLMLIHTAAMVMLVQRRMPGIGFSFIPNGREFVTGARNFLLFMPLGAAAGWALNVFRYRGKPAWAAVGIFAGVLWVVALSEEFAFRGVIQQTLKKLFANRLFAPYLARGIASIAFGAIHLWYPGGFPNWRMAILASIAGWFYGRSFDQAGTIRAAMVTHSITVTVWMLWLA